MFLFPGSSCISNLFFSGCLFLTDCPRWTSEVVVTGFRVPLDVRGHGETNHKVYMAPELRFARGVACRFPGAGNSTDQARTTTAQLLSFPSLGQNDVPWRRGPSSWCWKGASPSKKDAGRQVVGAEAC